MSYCYGAYYSDGNTFSHWKINDYTIKMTFGDTMEKVSNMLYSKKLFSGEVKEYFIIFFQKNILNFYKVYNLITKNLIIKTEKFGP